MKFLLIFLNVVVCGLCANVPQEISVEPFGLFEDIVNDYIIKPILDAIPSTLIQDLSLSLFDSEAFKLNISVINLELINLKSLNVNCTKVNLFPLSADISIVVPQIELNSNFSLDMVAGDEVINGHGSIKFVLDNLKIDIRAYLGFTLFPLKFKIKEITIKFPEKFDDTKAELTINDEVNPSFASELSKLVNFYIRKILTLVGDNQDVFSDVIGPIITDIINALLSDDDPITTPIPNDNNEDNTTTPISTSPVTVGGSTLPDGGSASTASFSFLMLVILISTHFF